MINHERLTQIKVSHTTRQAVLLWLREEHQGTSSSSETAAWSRMKNDLIRSQPVLLSSRTTAFARLTSRIRKSFSICAASERGARSGFAETESGDYVLNLSASVSFWVSSTLAALCTIAFPKQLFDGCPQRVPELFFLREAVGSPAWHCPHFIPNMIKDAIELRFRH